MPVPSANSMPGLAATLAVLALTACATYEPATFQTRGVQYKVSETDAWRLRKYWKDPTDTVAQASGMPPHYLSYAFTVISHNYAVSEPESRRCMSLTLTGIQRLPLDDVTERSAAGTSEVLRPVFFAELWTVEACGKRDTWRALGLWWNIHLTRIASASS